MTLTVRHAAKTFMQAGTATLVAAAEDALARLDERLATSPIRDAWIARTHLLDAAASQYLDGDLVTLENLALHDAAADIHAPTHALTRAHAVLRARRRIAAQPAGWALRPDSFARLRGAAVATDGPTAEPPPADPIADEEAAFAKELAALDAVLARSSRTLAGTLAGLAPLPAHPPVKQETDPPVSDERLARPEADSLEDWLALGQRFAPTHGAATAGAAWSRRGNTHPAWLGRLLVADLLRQRKKALAHLPCLSLGLRAVRATQPVGCNLTEKHWLGAIIAAADIGQKDHARWLTARTLLERNLIGRRSSSNLPALIDLVMARPLVSAAMVAKELKVSQRAALDLIGTLKLRELSGRKRYRVWAVL